MASASRLTVVGLLASASIFGIAMALPTVAATDRSRDSGDATALRPNCAWAEHTPRKSPKGKKIYADGKVNCRVDPAPQVRIKVALQERTNRAGTVAWVTKRDALGMSVDRISLRVRMRCYPATFRTVVSIWYRAATEDEWLVLQKPVTWPVKRIELC